MQKTDELVSLVQQKDSLLALGRAQTHAAQQQLIEEKGRTKEVQQQLDKEKGRVKALQSQLTLHVHLAQDTSALLEPHEEATHELRDRQQAAQLLHRKKRSRQLDYRPLPSNSAGTQSGMHRPLRARVRAIERKRADQRASERAIRLSNRAKESRSESERASHLHRLCESRTICTKKRFRPACKLDADEQQVLDRERIKLLEVHFFCLTTSATHTDMHIHLHTICTHIYIHLAENRHTYTHTYK